MLQRGRKPLNTLPTEVDVTAPNARVLPPGFLRNEEAEIFNEIVNACHPKHFVESDTPLLASYAQATLMARSGPIGNTKEWEKAVRVQAMLATRLRLAPQARMPHKLTETATKRLDDEGESEW